MSADRILVGRKTMGVQTAGVLAMAGCAILWSTSGLFIKLIDWQPFAIAGVRSAIASVFLWVVIRRPRFTFSFDQVVSALAYAATMILFVFANKHTTAANAILLQYGAPVYVAILGSMMLKEKPRIEHCLALFAILFGMILFFLDSLAGGNLLGDLVATLTGLTFALNIVMLRKQKDARPLDALLMGNIFTALIAGFISLFLSAPTLTAGSVLAIAELGIVQIGISSILFAYGIKRITALESILTAVLEPLFSPVWVFIVIGEAPGKRAVMGGLVIIGAVVTSSLVSIRRSAIAV
ncbi:MAG: EamA family transporter [Spirochaetae bacterium HGW-Spirochaetae-9]|nr:MAG: EamA family transporter [Spirochaetae bacterium HGW-Spirochaetae-9]